MAIIFMTDSSADPLQIHYFMTPRMHSVLFERTHCVLKKLFGFSENFWVEIYTDIVTILQFYKTTSKSIFFIKISELLLPHSTLQLIIGSRISIQQYSKTFTILLSHKYYSFVVLLLCCKGSITFKLIKANVRGDLYCILLLFVYFLLYFGKTFLCVIDRGILEVFLVQMLLEAK